MIRTVVVALALAMPTYAMAQEHQHQHPAATQQNHAAEMKAHEDFVQSVIDKQASLQLTNAQVARLKTFKTKMAAHHMEMMGSMKDMKEMKHDSMKDMKHDMNMDDPMHKEFMAIFTPAQRKKVDALMKEHMKSCAMSDDGQCKAN